jgi:hypothetical protein
MNLDMSGVSLDDVDYAETCWLGEDEPACHAPSDFVSASREERIRRRRRDLTDLQDLWRAEARTRKRERAPLFYRHAH